jgi:membrane protein
MDVQATQLRQQIEQTRAALATKLDLLERHVSRKGAAVLEQAVIGPVSGIQAAVARDVSALRQTPWLIMAVGGLLGYAGARQTGLLPRPAARAIATPRSAFPSAAHAMAAVSDARQEPPAPAAAPSMPGGAAKAAPPDPRLSPWKLGGLGAKELARRVVHEVQKDECLGRAAQLAYYFLFALFPFLLFLTTLLGYLPIPDLLDRLLASLGPMLPGEAFQLVQDNIRQLVTGQRGGLLSFGILAALWTSSTALTAIIDSLNRAYDVEEGRPFWKVRLIAVGLTVGLSVFTVVALVLLTFGPQIGGRLADLVGLGRVFELTWNLLRWPVIVGLLILAMAMLYYFAPNVEQEWQWITPGSTLAVLGWLLASLGFAFYVNRFGSYNATYGSIGAVIVLLTWMYVTGLFVLIGGEINAEIEHAAPGGKSPGDKQLSAPYRAVGDGNGVFVSGRS